MSLLDYFVCIREIDPLEIMYLRKTLKNGIIITKIYSADKFNINLSKS
jgi:hypothetical protein